MAILSPKNLNSPHAPAQLESPLASAASAIRIGRQVIHDLRNPLSSLKMIVETLAREVTNDRAKKRVSIAEKEIGSLERMLNAFATLCGRIDLARERSDLGEVIERALRRVRSELAERGAEVVVEPMERLPRVLCNPERLAESIGYLLLEASHYHGGCQLRLSTTGRGQGVELLLAPGPALMPSRGPALLVEAASFYIAQLGGEVEVGEDGARTYIRLPSAEVEPTAK